MLPGLTAPVEVLRDVRRAPDLRRHRRGSVPSPGLHARAGPVLRDGLPPPRRGRPAVELFGPSQVQTDAYVRTLGWRRVAEQELALLAPSTRRALDAYAAGVNAYLGDRSAAELSLEYRLLGLQGLDYTPELDRRRLGLLAQGDGLGPGLQPQPGGRAGAGHCRIRGRPRGQPVPRLPAGEPRPDRRTRHRGGREVRPDSAPGSPRPLPELDVTSAAGGGRAWPTSTG